MPFSESLYEENNNKEAFAELPGSTCYSEKKSESEAVNSDDSESETETVKGENLESESVNQHESESDSWGSNVSESSSEQDPFALERLVEPHNSTSSSNSSRGGNERNLDSDAHDCSSVNDSGWGSWGNTTDGSIPSNASYSSGRGHSYYMSDPSSSWGSV